jgi:hypothetical protein
MALKYYQAEFIHLFSKDNKTYFLQIYDKEKFIGEYFFDKLDGDELTFPQLFNLFSRKRMIIGILAGIINFIILLIMILWLS